MLADIKKEIFSHKIVYFLLSSILFISLFLRIYRTQDLMGFYYDQGRDALVIWKLWHEGKPFLIGPVTGLHGIFLGPLYYYLITPFYLIGHGSPVYPAVFLALTTVVSLIPLYVLGKEMYSRTAGIFAAVIGGFSYYLVLAGRWLSNPTPMFLMSVLILWIMWKIVNYAKNKKANYLWIILSLFIGFSLQFESASAVFYLPMVLAFAIWQKKKIPNLKFLIYCGLVLLLTFLPQILFDFRHDHIILQSFKRVLFSEKSFRLSFWQVFEVRLSYGWTVFWSKILPERKDIVLFFSIISFYSLFTKYKKLPDGIKLLLIFIGVPILCYFSFQGNEGNVFDYYMTGYYLPMILIFSISLATLSDTLPGKLLVASFFVIFLATNFRSNKIYLTQSLDNPSQIKLGTELAATDWVLEDAKNTKQPYNLKVYVPPVIPYSYEYLHEWRGTEKCGPQLCGFQKEQNQKVIYTVYENDTIDPNRLKGWKDENEKESTLISQKVFGGVTAEKRERND